ncbi:hypothetical protein C7M84_002682 [Penaeus vannamei]|uniref:CD80-like immunoglobulin C2-set domain-containing protein n=1 Tax=Penaeus vannamei TaxID=6689 RepID=A0A3R7QH08_PENVA|nr:hypothetical protein C7M84_002682 [Penaeus vannamei]
MTHPLPLSLFLPPPTEPPTSGPVITGGRKTYRVNDTVELMCTSSPSRPPAHLSWRINGRPAPQEHVTKDRPYVAHDGLLTQISRLAFVARPHHFEGGNLEVKCVAEISEHHLKHHKAIPKNFRPWERSFQASTGSSLGTSVAVLVVACLAVLVAAER